MKGRPAFPRARRIPVLCAAAVLLAAAFPVPADVAFSGLDLNDQDGLVFFAEQQIPSAPSYRTLFLARLSRHALEGRAQPLTCYPEQMEVLGTGDVLQVRNRYGTAWFHTDTETFEWKRLSAQFPAGYARTAPVQVSPDGKWLCYVTRTGPATGQLRLQEVATQKDTLLVADYPYSADGAGIKWSPDSATVLYEKDGAVYFASPTASPQARELPEQIRMIGRGTIRSVEWAADGSILYIDGDILYGIRQDELYTRGLYASVVGSGSIVGRLPFSFDALHDSFWCNATGSRIVVLTDDVSVGYYKIEPTGYRYASLCGRYPLTAVDGTLLGYHVFWTQDGTPSLWVDALQYDTGKKTSSVYLLQDTLSHMLDINGSVTPTASPDGRLVAFTGGGALFVFDASTWRQVAKLSGENVVSFCWAGNASLYVGGEKTVRLWTLPEPARAMGLTEGITRLLFLASADDAFWRGNELIASSGPGTTLYRYNFARSLWTELHDESVERPQPTERNERFRAFLGIAQNRQFSNSVMVRSLSGTVATYPVFAETEEPRPEPRRIALAFDAMDNAAGLSRILSVLEAFNVRALFFLNGEFMRRYPLETKQIVAAGHECASSFFSAADLKDGPYLIDSSFIKRGLARNEDEFFALTGTELSLLWHAPWHHDTPLMRAAGADAGYRYVDVLPGCDDLMTVEQAMQGGALASYQDAAALIERILATAGDGAVVSVSVGKRTGTRTDYLYDKLDLLIAALLDGGYTLVPVRDLID